MQITDWLETQFYGFLTCKKNDVELEKVSRAIRKKAREKGYTEPQMNEALKTALEYRKYVNSKSKQATVCEQPSPEPTPPEPKEVIQDHRTEEELSRRTQRSYEPMPERKDSDSAILRMLDEKRK